MFAHLSSACFNLIKQETKNNTPQKHKSNFRIDISNCDLIGSLKHTAKPSLIIKILPDQTLLPGLHLWFSNNL